MIPYATRTGTLRNLDLMRQGGWGILLTPFSDLSPLPPGFPRKILDNGAWTASQQGKPFDAPAFVRAVELVGAECECIVAPDIVCGGRDSLAMSLEWIPWLLTIGPTILVPLQDGMTIGDVVDLYRDHGNRIGLFLGGSTVWKEETMRRWGNLARRLGLYYHVGRVNTARRIHLASFSGADSFDGTSASKFAKTTNALTDATRQQDLFLA